VLPTISGLGAGAQGRHGEGVAARVGGVAARSRSDGESRRTVAALPAAAALP